MNTRRPSDCTCLLQCIRSILAQSGQIKMSAVCPLVGAKRTILSDGVSALLALPHSITRHCANPWFLLAADSKCLYR
jgi:hypothetical protein